MWLEGFGQDLKYALRQMRRSPGFAAAAVLTLALGLGTTVAMFSIVNGVLLEPLKYHDPGRLFLARTLPPPESKFTGDFPINGVQFERWHKYCRSCEQVALTQFLDLTLVGAGEPVKLPALSISADFFRTLGVQPALGRDFFPGERMPSATLILTDALWRSRFTADPAIIGRAVQINGESHTVIGVMPPGLRLPKGDQWGSYFGPSEAPMLFRMPTGWPARPVGNLNYSVLVRLKPGVSREQGIAELNALLADVYHDYALETRITLIPLQAQVTRNARSALWMLLGTVGVVLLIVCVNVGNLMLVRTTGRYREAGVRMALGASPRRLFALVLEEVLALVTIGGILGLAVANAGLKMFAAAAPAGLPRIDEVRIDWRVLLFAVAAIALSTVVCGLFPAWRLARTEPMESLKAGSGGAGESGGKLRLREAMISVEVALSTMLLIGGGLLMSSFLHLMRVEKGFDVTHVITEDVSFLNPKYTAGRRRPFVENMVAKLAAIPGVEAAAAINHLPLLGEDWVNELIDPDQPPRPAAQAALANNRFVSPGYWRAMGIPLMQGRYLDDSDKGKPEAVISEGAARYLWPNQNPIGRHVEGVGSPTPKLEVVGVVGDVHGAGLDRAPTMMIYEHYWRMQPIGISFVVRTKANPAAMAGAIREILARADPEMAIPPVRTMEQIVEQSVAARRFQMYLAAAFAAAALLLASLGIYGVISFAVARRTPEIGIRIALGARGGDLRMMILRQGMIPVAAGLAAGLVCALLAGRIISSELYGVQPQDPLVIASVASVLLAVALCACWFPARRATKVDPLAALRFE